jgi:hypothetical protein
MSLDTLDQTSTSMSSQKTVRQWHGCYASFSVIVMVTTWVSWR